MGSTRRVLLAWVLPAAALLVTVPSITWVLAAHRRRWEAEELVARAREELQGTLRGYYRYAPLSAMSELHDPRYQGVLGELARRGDDVDRAIVLQVVARWVDETHPRQAEEWAWADALLEELTPVVAAASDPQVADAALVVAGALIEQQRAVGRTHPFVRRAWSARAGRAIAPRELQDVSLDPAAAPDLRPALSWEPHPQAAGYLITFTRVRDGSELFQPAPGDGIWSSVLVPETEASWDALVAQGALAFLQDPRLAPPPWARGAAAGGPRTPVVILSVHAVDGQRRAIASSWASFALRVLEQP